MECLFFFIDEPYRFSILWLITVVLDIISALYRITEQNNSTIIQCIKKNIISIDKLLTGIFEKFFDIIIWYLIIYSIDNIFNLSYSILYSIPYLLGIFINFNSILDNLQNTTKDKSKKRIYTFFIYIIQLIFERLTKIIINKKEENK